eukprot:Hpha_TRINITY_DN29636_c0_g1::TRINITY_DN29636_c0_g1_i1::g.165247::m.165247
MIAVVLTFVAVQTVGVPAGCPAAALQLPRGAVSVCGIDGLIALGTRCTIHRSGRECESVHCLRSGEWSLTRPRCSPSLGAHRAVPQQQPFSLRKSKTVSPSAPAAWLPAAVSVLIATVCVGWGLFVVVTNRSRRMAERLERRRLIDLPEPAATDEVLVLKSPGEPLGISWEDHTLCNDVLTGTPADRAGVSRFVGRRLTHVNGQAVRTFGEIKSAA